MTKEFKAYVDGSGTGDPDLLVIAGYVAPSKVWDDFSKDWRNRLNEMEIARFKMNEMVGRPEFAPDIFTGLLKNIKSLRRYHASLEIASFERLSMNSLGPVI
jgi:hypothetical protein